MSTGVSMSVPCAKEPGGERARAENHLLKIRRELNPVEIPLGVEFPLLGRHVGRLLKGLTNDSLN